MPLQSDESRIIFGKLDSHADRISKLESFGLVTDHRLKEAEKNYHEICTQLVTTETKVMQSIGDISKKQDQLIADQYKREGASGAVKWFWGCLGVTLTCLQIYQVVKGG